MKEIIKINELFHKNILWQIYFKHGFCIRDCSVYISNINTTLTIHMCIIYVDDMSYNRRRIHSSNSLCISEIKIRINCEILHMNDVCGCGESVRGERWKHKSAIEDIHLNNIQIWTEICMSTWIAAINKSAKIQV